ncbi:hypothetical protein ACA614_13160 [Lactiplantibacillus plantarum]|uniref:hypothetical protein n=1 Tax=Lactiplantibacillus plantarum TaxID=1590 RepID=UPI000933044C|nr:hypothetical protein [Lactiplantibacillus plantarum]
MKNEIYMIQSADEAFKVGDARMMSGFNDDPTITKDMLIHLLMGLPLVDLSDGEFIHWLQLDPSALEYVSAHLKISQ